MKSFLIATAMIIALSTPVLAYQTGNHFQSANGTATGWTKPLDCRPVPQGYPKVWVQVCR